jgi:multidrug efflux pump subunit AcrB
MFRTSERAFGWVVATYGRTLAVALRFRAVTLAVLLATIGLNVYLFMRVPKGFFPQQDNGRIQGALQGDQDMSFQAMDASLRQMMADSEPAWITVAGGKYAMIDFWGTPKKSDRIEAMRGAVARCRASRRRSIRRCQRSHEPMSASLPVPPG